MTTEEENLVVSNINMAYDVAWAYYKRCNKYVEYDELKSEALVGLTKAAKTFNPTLKLAFSTYAYKVMQNEVLTYVYRQCKKQETSIYTEVCDNLEIVDSLASDDNIEDNIFDKLCVEDLHSCIEALPERFKTILKFRLSGMTMVDIAHELNLSQPQISRDYHSAINRLKTKLKYWR